MNDLGFNLSYSDMLDLQRQLNLSLQSAYEQQKGKVRRNLADFLIPFVESLIDELNKKGHRFGRCEYGGSTEFEHSEQYYSNSDSPGEGVVIHFVGYSAQVSWEGEAGIV